LAARHRSQVHLDQLEDVLSLITRNAEGPPKALADLNIEFHKIIRQAATNGHLNRFLSKVEYAVVPGIKVHRVGGHAAGLQVVRANTARGNVVLASDATHYYANIGEVRPYSVVKDLAGMYEAFEIVRSLADSPEHVVPGHDPLVMERFPTVSGELEGVAARIA
jgi:glyoxylase-like metal-dependent hydrolase (beta-lactamase superfamily II)